MKVADYSATFCYDSSFKLLLSLYLARFKHIFDKYAISARGIIHKDVRDGADELTVLEYG